MSNVKKQNTLFRFVSLRSPELSKKEDQNTRFIFCPKEEDSFFTRALKKMPKSGNKQRYLYDVSQNFTAFQNESEVEDLCGKDFVAVSSWIASRRANMQVEKLLEKIEDFEILTQEIEQELWEQLYYQVINPSSVYVKETIMQVLTLQNILKYREEIQDINEFTAKLPDLVKAKVVIPAELFEKESNGGGNATGDEQTGISKKLLAIQKVTESRAKIEEYEKFISQIEVLAKKEDDKYQEEYTKAYNEAYKKYLEFIESLPKQGNNTQNPPVTRAEGEGDTDGNGEGENAEGEDSEGIALPEFSFEYPKPDILKNISTQIDPQDQEFFNELYPRYTTVQQIVNFLKGKISEENQNVFKYKPTNNAFSGAAYYKKYKALPFAIKGLAKGLKNSILFDLALLVEIPGSTYEVGDFSYTLTTEDGKTYTETDNYAYFEQGVLVIRNLFENSLEDFKNITVKKTLKGAISFINGKDFTFELDLLDLKKSYNGTMPDTEQGDTGEEIPEELPPLGFGVTQLGIADYKKVVSEVCDYEVGEVSNIENVMAREFREKSTKKFQQTQVSTTEISESEKEKLYESTASERFEMQSEISKLMQEQTNSSINASANYSGFNLSTGFAVGRSKEESNRQAVSQSKELTQRAMERIVTKYRKEVSTKVTNEFTEENLHGFDNREGENHVSGVYRFINAIYRNQIYNYGKRLMYEFVIPQPSKFHQLAMETAKTDINILEKPIDPRETGLEDFSKLNRSNFQNWAATYGAEVTECPDDVIYVNKTFSGAKASSTELFEGNEDIRIPEGYIAKSAKMQCYFSTDGDHKQGHAIDIAFGNIVLYKHSSRGWDYASKTERDLHNYRQEYKLDDFRDKVSVSYASMNYLTFGISLSIKTELSIEAKEKWQIETFNAIMQSYFEQLEEYKARLEEIKAKNEERQNSNPLFYREIENTVLRKNCISYLLPQNSEGTNRVMGKGELYSGESIGSLKINQSQELDEYGSFVKFMEQAFEWDLMSYNFYPFYWGDKDNWEALYQYECNDPLFKSFMQSGLARVIVTVKPGFEDAIMHYMATGQIWNGGEIPVLNDPLYLSIVDELKEQEYVVEETWETVVPTSLIAIQSGGVAVEASGLPSLRKDKGMGRLIGTDSKLGLKQKEDVSEESEKTNKL